jgi:magnesium-transporting ATPase (P-type)
MSVTCLINKTNSCKVYAKGSPEMMLTIMNENSIPKNYQEILKEYASHGFRVLAIASKSILLSQLKTISRSEAESSLIFNGF